ncbi:13384_t:CDS:2, partial [Ambispora leptoticha]
ITEIIKYLRGKNLKLNNDDLTVFRKERITGSVFLNRISAILVLRLDLPTNTHRALYQFLWTIPTCLLKENRLLVIKRKQVPSITIEVPTNFISTMVSFINSTARTEMGSDPVIVGSRPPADDCKHESLVSWTFLIRNCENKEKMVDISLACEGMEIITETNLGILVLIAPMIL